MKHAFLFEPGTWIGEGSVSFTASTDTVRFFTRWNIAATNEGSFQCLQEVELLAMDQTTENRLVVTPQAQGEFAITLENELMGKVSGKGVYDNKKIAWELRDIPGMEGFEVFELQENGEYHFHSEFSSPPFRTKIQGRLWRQESAKE